MAVKEKAGDDVLRPREVPVDVCLEGDGFLLRVDNASIWFDREAAEEILMLLEDALVLGASRGLVSNDSN
jgi:hypothetical protein